MPAFPRPAPAILWGDNLENALVFGYPVEAATWARVRREEYETVQAFDGSAEDAWDVGQDYELKGAFRWVELRDRTAPTPATGWSGPAGVQSFLDWARDRRRFRFCPDSGNLNFWVADCWLEDPSTDEPPIEDDGTRKVDLVVRNTATDFGQALRAVAFELAPGGMDVGVLPIELSNSDTRRYHTRDGLVGTAAGAVLRDRHWDGGRKVVLFEAIARNDILQSEDLSTTWGVSATTVSANATASPEVGAPVTADRLVETAVTSVHEIVQAATVTAGEHVFFAVYVKAAERFRGAIYWRNAGGSGDYLEITFNLTAKTIGTTVSNAAGGGVLSLARLVQLANGWFRVEGIGRFNSTETSANLTLRILDDAGGVSYLGDVSKGIYWWGAQLGRGFQTVAPPPVMSYVKTTTIAVAIASDAGFYSWPWPPQGMWGYMKFVELGEVQRSSFGDFLWIGSGIGADNRPVVRLLTGASTNGTNPFWRFNWSANGGTNQSAGILAATPAIGDTVELFFRLLADGHVEITQAINAALGVLVSSSGGAAPSAAAPWPSNTLRITRGAAAGLMRLKLGFNFNQVSTMAQAREA